MNGAIETEYRGIRFRSRLEARWAVFFDVAGIEWKYETEGYEVDGHRYLPDFWLPDSKVWVEVKGERDGLRNDFARMSVMLSRKSPLPGFADGDRGLMLLGDVPHVEDGLTVLHPCLTRDGGAALRRTWGMFAPQKGRAPAKVYQLPARGKS